MKPATSKSRNSKKTEENIVVQMIAEPPAEEISSHIATAAYYKAAARGFNPGRELDDWLEAESEFLK
jgi:hypothetical protein